MARLCGVSRQSVIHWRKPKFKRLDASVALTICAEYSVNMRWLVLGEGEMAAQSTLAFDSKRLASAIQLLETHLQDSGARLSTEKKARAIAIIYELLSGVVPDASEPSVIKNVLRLVA
jgi:hypothetical protein